MHFKRISRDKLPKGLKEPIRDLMYNAKHGHPTEFHNHEGLLPEARGGTYFEHDVGHDRQGGRGRFRVIALVDGGDRLQALYFTSQHYQSEWTEITW